MAEPLTALPVEFLFRAEIETRDPPIVTIGGGPLGTRVVVNAAAGRVEGPRISGAVLPPGGDWATLCPDGSLRLDVRILVRTDDGADILVTYTGVGIPSESGFDLRTAPRFETGDERYAWLNQVAAVGIGRLEPPGVVYEVYQLT